MFIVKNNKKRIYNGIRPQQLITVDEARKNYLLANGFTLVEKVKVKKAKTEVEKVKVKKAKTEVEKVEVKKDVPEDEEPGEREELMVLVEAGEGKRPPSNIKIETLREKTKTLEA